jgi:hypothetical protein
VCALDVCGIPDALSIEEEAMEGELWMLKWTETVRGSAHLRSQPSQWPRSPCGLAGSRHS